MPNAVFDGSRLSSLGQTIPGHPVPDHLAQTPPDRLALVEDEIVDLATLSTFWVNERGEKYGAPDDPTWQAVEASWDTPLIREGGVWRIETEADRAGQRRQSAAMPKPAFLAAAYREGALTKDEAVLAGQGGWPAAFEPALVSMSDEEQVEARAHWNSVSTVLYGYRTTGLVAEIGAARTGRTVTDLLDAIFGIET